MYFCTISDGGLSCSSDDLKDLLDKLHQYLKEAFGTYTISSNDKQFKNALEIISPGEYYIQTKRDYIYCNIELA